MLANAPLTRKIPPFTGLLPAMDGNGAHPLAGDPVSGVKTPINGRPAFVAQYLGGVSVAGRVCAVCRKRDARPRGPLHGGDLEDAWAGWPGPF